MPRVLFALVLLFASLETTAAEGIEAGAARVDITPPELPVIRNGSFLEASVDQVIDRLHSRCLVLREPESGTRVAIAVVDTSMIPRPLCDTIKKEVTARTGIPGDHILIAATHCHSAPSVMHFCLGSRADPAYTAFLPPLVADSIVQAHAIWHLLSAVATFAFFLFLRTERERVAIDAGRDGDDAAVRPTATR